jgi:hypothetical protein
VKTRFLLGATAIVALMACGDTATTDATIGGSSALAAKGDNGVSIVLTPPKSEVPAGKSIQLEYALVNPAGNTVPSNRPITWTSSDEKVATVVDGAVTGVNPGFATITASGGGATGSAFVFVIKGKLPPKCDPLFQKCPPQPEECPPEKACEAVPAPPEQPKPACQPGVPC